MTPAPRSSRGKRRSLAEINIVPYIDVMLVLLVIFMITAPLLAQGVKVDLPEATTEPLPAESNRPIVVTVDRAGSLFLNLSSAPSDPIAPAQLTEQVASALRDRPQTPVMVRGDSAVAYSEVIKAMTLLQSAGAKSIGLVTEPPEAKSP